jgi:tryptophanyl-tRNA synthetase
LRTFAPDKAEQIIDACTRSEIGFHDCRDYACEALIRSLQPIQERRRQYELEPERVWQVLRDGAKHASAIAESTMRRVRGVLGMGHEFDSNIRLSDLKNAPAEDLILDFVTTQQLQDHSARGDLRRNVWLGFVAKQFPLVADKHRTYISKRGKRVAVVSSSEHSPGEFKFFPRERTYEIIVLLCHESDGRLVDFVIPFKELRSSWQCFYRDSTKKSVQLDVFRHANDYYLRVPSHDAKTLMPFYKKYEALA